MEQKPAKKKSDAAKPEAPAMAAPMIAKKNWLIVQNEHRIEIAAGEDLSARELPEQFVAALKTEGVI